MKYLSLFSGIGGFELGIKQAHERLLDNQPKTSKLSAKPNIRGDNGNSLQGTPTCIGYSEIDKYAIQIYQKHFPEHKNFHDITKINADTLPDFDLLVGGFPCQAFSIAGKRRGFDDTRGTLFFEIARILKAKKPRNFVLENVKGLLSHDGGRTFATIIATLTKLGYCVEWQVLNSKNHGVPQNRERVIIVGHLGGIPERKVFPIGESNGEYAKGLKQLNSPKFSSNRIYAKEGIMPNLRTMQGGNLQPKFLAGTRIRRLTPLECERLMSYPDGWTEGLSDTQRYKTLGNGIVSNVVAEVVKRMFTP